MDSYHNSGVSQDGWFSHSASAVYLETIDHFMSSTEPWALLVTLYTMSYVIYICNMAFPAATHTDAHILLWGFNYLDTVFPVYEECPLLKPQVRLLKGKLSENLHRDHKPNCEGNKYCLWSELIVLNKLSDFI